MRQRKLGSHTPPCHRRMVITTLFSVLLAALQRRPVLYHTRRLLRGVGGGGGGVDVKDPGPAPPPPHAINTIIGHSRHLRGFWSIKKKWPRGCAWLDAGVAHGCARLSVKMAHGCAQLAMKMAHGCARRGPTLAHGYNHVSEHSKWSLHKPHAVHSHACSACTPRIILVHPKNTKTYNK